MVERIYSRMDNPGETTEHFLEDGFLHVKTEVDHVAGNAARREIRDNDTYNNAGVYNEAFSFTEAEYAMIQKTQPQLFRGSPQDQRLAWVAYAQTMEGKHFRVK